MQLVTPAWLALSGLVVTLFWLHTRTSRRRLTVSTTFLWSRVRTETASSPQRRKPALDAAFWLQALFVLLAALALSRPFIGGSGAVEDHLVLVIDSSASMGAVHERGTTRFEAAVEAGFELAETFLDSIPGGRVSIVAASARPSIVAAFSTGVEDVRQALKAMGPPEHLPSDIAWREVVRRLEALTGAGSSRIIIVTDGAGADPSEHLAPMAATNAVEFVSVGGRSTNLALVNWVATPIDDGGRWTVSGEVWNFSDEAQTASVELRVQAEGAPAFLDWDSSVVELAPGQSDFVAMELSGLPAGLIEVSIPDDALALDNRVTLSVGPAASSRVLLVGPVDPYLEALIRSWPDAVLFYHDRLPAVTIEFDLVIANGVEVDRPADTHTVFFGTTPPGPREPPHWVTSPTLTGWLDRHPLAAGVDWTNLHVDRALVTPRLPGAYVVLESGGRPLIQARDGPAGVEVMVAFAPEDTNWPRLSSFAVFFDNLRRWMRQSAEAGAGENGYLDGHLVEELDVRARPWLDEAVSAGGLRVVPLTRWIALIALGVLLLEAFVSRVVRLNRRRDAGRTAVVLGRGPWPFALRICAALALAGAVGGLPWPSKARENTLVVVVEPGVGLPHIDVNTGKVLAGTPAATHPELVGVVSLGSKDGLTPWPRDGSTSEPALGGVPSGDLELALELALGMAPFSRPSEVIVLSDGVETRGRSWNAVRRYVERGVPIHVVPQPGRPAGDALVERVTPPRTVRAGSRFALHALVFSQDGGSGVIRFLREGELIAEEEVLLRPGRNRIEANFSEQDAGIVLYEVDVWMPGDPVLENNRNGAVVRVEAPPRIAVIAERREDAEALGRVLEVQGFDFAVMLPHMAPWEADGWRGYDGAVLFNLPAIGLHSRQQAHLEWFVKELGGGLVILGGENSFGPGGYYQTALEHMSPLSSRVEQDAPSVAMLFVLDKSGSMNQLENGVPRLTIAKEATLTAVELLSDESVAGIVVFDSEARVLVPMQLVSAPESFARGLETLTAGGGTSIYPGLATAYEELEPIDAMAAHIVLMTDGLSSPGDFDEIIGRIAEKGITVSTVAIGAGADSLLLRRIAREGNGMAHVTTDWEALPSILAQEALLSSANFVVDEEASPRWSEPNMDFVRGLPDSLPPIKGYVRTTAKPQAQIYMVAVADGEEVPLLAGWQYGLGRVVAFASHGLGRWTEAWISQSWFPRLWSQAARWAMMPASSTKFEFLVTRDRDEVVVQVNFAAEEAGDEEWLSADSLSVHVEDPRGLTTVVELAPAGPGTYEGRMPVSTTGVYRAAFGEVEGAVFVSYPTKLGTTLDADVVLEMLAYGTGGAVTLDMGDLPFGAQSSRWMPTSGFVPWMLTGLLLFLADLTVRTVRRQAPRLSTILAVGRGGNAPGENDLSQSAV